MLIINKFAVIFLLVFSSANAFAQNRISVDSETTRVHAGKKTIVRSQMLYYPGNGDLFIKYSYPENYIYRSNSLGEAAFYYPKRNEITLLQDPLLTSENNLLHYFAQNAAQDMGLKSLGFELKNTRFEAPYTIDTWTPPRDMLNQWQKIEIVHENYLPIYAAYYNVEGQKFKQIYYYNYQFYQTFMLPEKITEISHISPLDSIVSRQILTNVLVNQQVLLTKDDFKIPDDAQLVK